MVGKSNAVVDARMNKFEIAVTAIVFKEDRILVTKRHPEKKRWPNFWTVPGGKVESSDYLGTPTPINNQWYGVLENAVTREVLEETGIEVDNIKYLTNIAIPDCFIISFVADYKSGEVKLQKEEAVEYAWVTLEEALMLPLIDGIGDEITFAYKYRGKENGKCRG